MNLRETPSPKIIRPCIALLLMAASGACGSSGNVSEGSEGITFTGGDSGVSGQDGGVQLDLGADGSGGGNGCASTVIPAENKKAADIIVVVDNSGSMDFEASSVQANLNGFSQQIVDSGIDVHVVLISSYPDDGNGICIDPPLGIGGCPEIDNNPPTFLHIDQNVGSNDALEEALEYEPQWRVARRQDASLHFVVVSDDESDITALEFDTALKALDPGYAEYKLNGIVCTTVCEETDEIGAVYIELGQMTDGIISDLCLQDFQPVFDELANLVISGAQIACEWDIPDPPPGQTLDPTKVNVRFDDGLGGGFSIGNVETAADCAYVGDGWYYDNPAAPTKILACPQTCEKIQGADAAMIVVELGCETVPAG